MRSPSAFWFELRRRNVVRAALLYVGAVWALAQGMAQLAPVFGLPDSLTRWFVLACTLGFPFWLLLAWLYELTPTGLKRESAARPEPDPARPRANRRLLDYAIIAVLSLAVVLLATNTLFGRKAIGTPANAADLAAAFARIPEKSVAVLPMVNGSSDQGQDYLGDGLSEQLISDLTQINGLRVIGKYSSFRYRDSKASTAEIGLALGVAHLIEGSVRRDGARLRVVIDLIRAVDGSSVWSQTYDREWKDVFAIQSEIGRGVADALQIKLLGKDADPGDRPPSGNAEAYTLMLQGRAIARRGTEADYRRGIALLLRAVRLDPDYAFAWSVLANYQINLGSDFLGGEAREQAWAAGRASADRQLALAPRSAAAYVTRGYVFSQLDSDQVGALAAYRKAVELAPHDDANKAFLAYQLAVTGHLRDAADRMREALTTDPVRADWHSSLAGILSALGELDAAERAYGKVLSLQPDYPGVHAALAQIRVRRGDAPGALAEAGKETDPAERAWAIAMAHQAAGNEPQANLALRAYVAAFGDTQPYEVATLYAVRRQPDETFAWLDRAWARHDPNVTNLLGDAFILAFRSDPRFAAFCRKAGLPIPEPPDGHKATMATGGAG